MESPCKLSFEDYGPYEIYETLGHGRKTTVVRAIEKESGRVVALKRLHKDHAKDALSIRLFVREARIAQALTHPNIVKVHSVGTIEGEHYMSMEWIDGLSLASLMNVSPSSTRMPVGVALWILRKVLGALDYAMVGTDDSKEALGIVHRDICPSNVIVTTSGEVKVIDFGLAKSLVGRYATKSGVVKGNLGYMAPEVFAGRSVDSRSDLFSAAVVAWELLANRRLFGGSPTQQLSKRESFRFVAPSRLGFGISQDIDDLLGVALARDPSARWPSAAVMASVLDLVIQHYGRSSSLAACQDFLRQRLGLPSESHHPAEDTEYSDVGQMRTLPAPLDCPGQSRACNSRKARRTGRPRFGPNSTTELDPVFDALERHRGVVANDDDA